MFRNKEKTNQPTQLLIKIDKKNWWFIDDSFSFSTETVTWASAYSAPEKIKGEPFCYQLDLSQTPKIRNKLNNTLKLRNNWHYIDKYKLIMIAKLCWLTAILQLSLGYTTLAQPSSNKPSKQSVFVDFLFVFRIFQPLFKYLNFRVISELTFVHGPTMIRPCTFSNEPTVRRLPTAPVAM